MQTFETCARLVRGNHPTPPSKTNIRSHHTSKPDRPNGWGQSLDGTKKVNQTYHHRGVQGSTHCERTATDANELLSSFGSRTDTVATTCSHADEPMMVMGSGPSRPGIKLQQSRRGDACKSTCAAESIAVGGQTEKACPRGKML